MRGTSVSIPAAVAALALLSVPVLATPSYKGLPLADGKPVLARINGEPLMLAEFEQVFAEAHSAAADNSTRSRPNPSQLLDRLINAKLVLQEARNIGLDELPEVQVAQKAFAEDTLRAMLYGYEVRNIVTPDPKEVQRRYRESVKEVRLASVLFDDEADAKRLEGGIRAGGRFDVLAKRELAAGKAKGAVVGQFMRVGSLNPEVARAVSGLKKGAVSPVIRIGRQFAIVRLEGVRYSKDEAARRKAEREALQAKKVAALERYAERLRKKYAKVDRKLFDGLDFEAAQPGLEMLRKDPRVVATIKGEKPITVAEFTGALEKKFFHGAEQAAREQKLNRKKEQVLYEILNKRVALKEAKVLKLDKTQYFQEKAAENRNGLLFGAFVQKVIVPEINVNDEGLKAYYDAHVAQYTFPEMVRIESLAFSRRANAEDALVKLRGGADFQWMRANAEGQANAAAQKDLLVFRGQLLDATTLPEGVQRAISGASAGEYRLFPDPGAVCYVLQLVERIPSRPMPLDSVKGEVRKKVYSDELQASLRDWEEKLRKASEVTIYARGEQLDRIVRSDGR